MNIIEYYNEKCKDENWHKKYYQTGKNDDGSIFTFLNQNYRTLSDFESYFLKFKEYAGIPRGNKWAIKETTGQLIAKQYVTNMVKTFLFMSQRNENNELVYYLTSRGQNFYEMLQNDFSEAEKKFLTILYILNASFENIPRYLLKQSWDVLNNLVNVDFDINNIIEMIIYFLKEEINERHVDNIFNYDIVWLLSFYTDTEFLKLFKISTEEEKKIDHEDTQDRIFHQKHHPVCSGAGAVHAVFRHHLHPQLRSLGGGNQPE